MHRSLDDFISKKSKTNPSLERELLELGNYTDLALKIQAIRIAEGLTQRELAEKVGTSQTNIVRWETPGYTSYTVRSLERLAKVLGVALRIDLQAVTADIRVQKPYLIAAAFKHVSASTGIRVSAAETQTISLEGANKW